MDALFGFIGASLAFLLLPLRFLALGRRRSGRRKGSGGVGDKWKTAHRPVSKAAASKTKKAAFNTVKKKTTMKTARTTVKTATTHKAFSATSTYFVEYPEPKPVVTVEEKLPMMVPDESTPKSTPKNEKDRYIRKRMIIAGSYYCDKSVLDTLEVGSLIDLEAEPDNPYDEDAVKLLFNGKKIGYIAKKDLVAFAMCLKLNRRIYGVITAIIKDGGQTKYEYETWFEGN